MYRSINDANVAKGNDRADNFVLNQRQRDRDITTEYYTVTLY